jgi:DNA (cytosine-5)-methyltransferase 1
MAVYRVQCLGTLLPPLDAKVLHDPWDSGAVTVEQAISDLVSLETGRRNDEVPYKSLASVHSEYQREMRHGAGDRVNNVQVPRINRDTELRLRSLPEGGNYRDLPEDFRARYLTGQRWGPHTGSNTLGRKHYYAYRKLHRGLWAWTLNTKADSAYHYTVPRALSVREFARLQSFPDRFCFTTNPRKGPLPGRIEGGAAHSRYRQAGNAVPPRLAKAIAENIQEALSDQVRESVASQIA